MNSTTQSWMLLMGRLLLSLVFVVVVVRTFMNMAGSVGYYAKLGFPAPEAMVWLALIVQICGAALLIVGWQTKWAGWLMILFVAIATLMAHRFWEFDASQYANQLNHMLKNLALIGGLLYVVALGPGAMSLEGRKRGA